MYFWTCPQNNDKIICLIFLEKNMKKYSLYMQEVGVPDYSSKPESKYVWHAYKNGSLVCTSEESRADAELNGNTKTVEKVLQNEEEINAIRENANRN